MLRLEKSVSLQVAQAVHAVLLHLELQAANALLPVLHRLIAVDVVLLGREVEVEAVRQLGGLLGSDPHAVLLDLLLAVPQRRILVPRELLVHLEPAITAMLVLPRLHIYY